MLKWLLKRAAKKINKEDFLEQLKKEWLQYLEPNIDADEYIDKIWNKIQRSPYKSIFETVGVTKEDIRRVLTEITTK